MLYLFIELYQDKSKSLLYECKSLQKKAVPWSTCSSLCLVTEMRESCFFMIKVEVRFPYIRLYSSRVSSGLQCPSSLAWARETGPYFDSEYWIGGKLMAAPLVNLCLAHTHNAEEDGHSVSTVFQVFGMTTRGIEIEAVLHSNDSDSHTLEHIITKYHFSQDATLQLICK